MPDLTPIVAWLSQLGPWGVILGVALTLIVQRMKQQPKQETPLLDATLNFLKVKHTSAPVQPAKQDIDHETVAELLGGSVVVASKVDEKKS